IETVGGPADRRRRLVRGRIPRQLAGLRSGPVFGTGRNGAGTRAERDRLPAELEGILGGRLFPLDLRARAPRPMVSPASGRGEQPPARRSRGQRRRKADQSINSEAASVGWVERKRNPSFSSSSGGLRDSLNPPYESGRSGC